MKVYFSTKVAAWPVARTSGSRVRGRSKTMHKKSTHSREQNRYTACTRDTRIEDITIRLVTHVAHEQVLKLGSRRNYSRLGELQPQNTDNCPMSGLLQPHKAGRLPICSPQHILYAEASSVMHGSSVGFLGTVNTPMQNSQGSGP